MVKIIKMEINKKTLVSIAVIGIILSSCYKHNWETIHPLSSSTATPCMVDTGTVISYSANIVPIINSKCAIGGCHAAGGSGSANDYTFYGTNSTGIYSQCRHDTSGSAAWQDITGASGNPMPKVGSTQLTPCEKASIRNWIHQGALNN